LDYSSVEKFSCDRLVRAPVLSVTDVEASLLFYSNRLGFTIPGRYEEDGGVHVARRGRSLILADHWPELAGEDRQGADAHFPERRTGDAPAPAETALLRWLRPRKQAGPNDLLLTCLCQHHMEGFVNVKNVRIDVGV
jgi:catechol 2,3-dioxygenase-like lactoylglutathione lyase family enzyme